VLTFCFLLFVLGDQRLRQGVTRGIEGQTRSAIPQLAQSFQSSFYFYYEDQFLPVVQKVLTAVPSTASPQPKRIRLLSREKKVLFDSQNLESGKNPAVVADDKVLLESLARNPGDMPQLIRRGFSYQVVLPQEGELIIVMDFFAMREMIALSVWFLFLMIGFVFYLRKREKLQDWVESRFRKIFHFRFKYKVLNVWKNFWKLRAKILAAIILVNLLTAAIVFWSLVRVQSREMRQKIERDSLVFSQLSLPVVIDRYEELFYFHYEQFLVEVRKLIATHENLERIRLISPKLKDTVLFDSELNLDQLEKVTYSGEFPLEIAEIEKQVADQNIGSQLVKRNNAQHLLVVARSNSEVGEALYKVEFLYNFNSLLRSQESMRTQILYDLMPAVLLGVLIASILAHFLISQIRKLRGALQKVSDGNYDLTLKRTSNDEIGDLFQAFNEMTTELRRKKELRKYLSDSTYRQIMQATESPDGGGVRLGGVRVEATILFCDIRNFVSLCESLDPEEVTRMLNDYFSEMVDVIHRNGGEVDKFIGDALLAVFYSQERSLFRHSQSDFPRASSTALQSIYCALEMREKLSEFNNRRRSENKVELDIGIGISHGELISGPIGAKERMDFTVIGDVVNLASRIEKLSKLGRHTKIVFSEQVEEKVQNLLEYEPLGMTEETVLSAEQVSHKFIAGKSDAVRVFELIGVKDLQALIDNLASPDEKIRRRSVELLGQSRNSHALEPCLKMLRDPDEQVRLFALVAAGKLDVAGIDAAESIFKLLRDERSERVLATAIAVLGKLCRDDRVLTIAPFLESKNERIVANTIEALGQLRSPVASDLILAKLGSRNNRVKANAAMALFAAGHLEVIDTLKPMLMHSDYLMRSSAAFALGELTLIAAQESLAGKWKRESRIVKSFLADLQECVPMLVTLLRDSEAIVKRQAIIALGKIRDRSAILPLLDVIEPEKESKELMREVSSALRSIGSHRLIREVIEKLS